MACALCNRQHYIAVDLPRDGGTIWFCQLCAGEVLTGLLQHLDSLTMAQAADALAGVGDGVALRQALHAVGLPQTAEEAGL